MKKLFTSLTICLILFFLMLSCTDQNEPQNIEVIQAELDAFIREEMKKSDEPMTSKIMDFLAERGFTPITEEMPEYQEMLKMSKDKRVEENEFIMKFKSQNDITLSELARVMGCNVESSGYLDAGGGCWVNVYEYGEGCYHKGCVSNSWWCGGNWQGEAYYC